ncbi:MAG: hypothetical protein ABJN34_12650 [Litoreibacter sp.]|uniref:hypothetical protein n=1 Tax=Litoreibacter sp. TaxID=1969459 RepID=UPI00329714D3
MATSTPPSSNVLPLQVFLGILVVISACDVLTLSIPAAFTQIDFQGTPNNTIGSLIVTGSQMVSHFGHLALLCLPPVVIAAFLPVNAARPAAFAVSAFLLFVAGASVVLSELAAPILTHMHTKVYLFLSSGLSLLSSIVPICAAIWISTTFGTRNLTRFILVLSAITLVVQALLVWGVSPPYAGHYAFALYTFSFAVTFKNAPHRLRLWGGLLVAAWLAHVVLFWGPDLLAASAISHAPSRFETFLNVLTQSPPAPQYRNVTIPLLFAAMLVFSSHRAKQATLWFPALVGAIIFTYASMTSFNIFVFSPKQALIQMRMGALGLGAASLSALLWLMLLVAPFAMLFASVRLYRNVPVTRPSPNIAHDTDEGPFGGG